MRLCHLLCVSVAFLAQSAIGASTEQPYVVGVLAKQGSEKAYAQWNSTFSLYLSSALGMPFTMLPLTFEEIFPAVERGEVDFMFANPSYFVCLELEYGLQAITSIRNLRQGQALTKFGGVFFRSTNRPDLTSVRNVSKRKFEAVSWSSLGGFQMGWREMQNYGLSPLAAPAELRFGSTHANVVYDVINGEVDIGTVRTDTIERMIERGEISEGQVVVIDQKDHGDDFTFATSTELYPEWPLAVMPHVSDSLKKRVAKELLHLDSSRDDEHASILLDANIREWVPALSYVPVYSAQRDIELLNAEGTCTRSDKLYEGIKCPEGHSKLPEALIYAENCPEGRICLKTPCIKDCKTGTYLFRQSPSSEAQCAACIEGLDCRGGSGAPLQLAGFYAVVSSGSTEDSTASYSVYRCRNQWQCPSRVAGTCARGRQGIGCGNCQANHYKSEEGRCDECEGASFIPLVIALVVVALSFVPLYAYASSDMSKQHLTTVTAALVLGQLAGAMQALSVFQNLRIEWGEPTTSILAVINIVAFDLDVLQVQCLLGRDDPITKMLLTVLFLPVFMAMLWCCSRVMKVSKGRTLTLDQYANSVGMATVMVYISIAIAVLRPLHCISNPNGTKSMASNPAVVCWESEQHLWMFAIGLVGFIAYPVAILAIVIRITWRLPALIGSGKGLRLLERYRFLFQRFKQDTYYWGVFYLLRSFSISIIPVLFPDDAIFQVLSINIILIASLMGTSCLMPWRTPLANVTDLATTAGLAIFMQAGAFIVDADADEAMGVLQVLLLGTVGLIALVILGVACVVLRRRLMPEAAYAAFLCHHKEGSGCLARYIKMVLETKSRDPIFLDSDQLTDIDNIFDIVRAKTKSLVVILTKMTLARPWCAGELTTAVKNGIPIVPVHCLCSDYAPPCEEFLAKLSDIWTEEQSYQLGLAGIDLAAVKDAYRLLANLEVVELSRLGPAADLDASISGVARRCALRQWPVFGAQGRDEQQAAEAVAKGARIVVTGICSDPEARCACELLRCMVQAKTQVVVATVSSPENVQPNLTTANYLIVVLTKGLLQDSAFAKVLLEFAGQDHDKPVDILPVLADSTFAFPGPEFFVDIKKGERGDCLAGAYQKMLNTVALPFSPHLSSSLIKTQVFELCLRLQLSGSNVAGGIRSSGAGSTAEPQHSANSGNQTSVTSAGSSDAAEYVSA